MIEVSVIVPAHGSRQFLGAALDSIKAQGLDALELIVVDDGSDPPIAEFVRSRYPGARVLRQERRGPSAARNNGLCAAKGRFITFLDADDLWTENALSILLKGFRDAPRAEVVQGLVRKFHSRENGAAPDDCGPPYAGFNLGALMIRREVLIDAGQLDERLWHSEDVDLFMRLHDRGVRRLVVPQLVLEYRLHSESLTAGSSAPGRDAARNWIRLLHARRSSGRLVVANDEPAPVPATSLLLVVRNARKYLPAALHCIRSQSVAPTEIVALVGPSEDGTREYLEAQRDIRLVLQEGEGLAAARNQALSQARGEIVSFYDHDDLWDPRKLELQLRSLALFEGPAASIVGFRLVEDPDPNDPVAVTDPGRQVPRLGWTPSALVAHREVFRQLGPFDPALGMGCDTDWFRRLRLSGIGCGLVPQPLLHKRIHGGNLSAEPQRNRAAMFRLLQKHRSENRRD